MTQQEALDFYSMMEVNWFGCNPKSFAFREFVVLELTDEVEWQIWIQRLDERLILVQFDSFYKLIEFFKNYL